jgi:nucleotide-binding universal stress UspA family protein
MSTCPAHVAVFMDRGFRAVSRVLVPYLGSAHDQLALELAARMARHHGAHVLVLHVVPPLRASSNRVAEARAAVQRVFGDSMAEGSAAFKVVEDQSPVGVILHQAQQFDLVVIGVAEEWGLESRLFGWRPETIARDCPASLLIVRRFEGKPGAAPMAAPQVEPRVEQTATDCG